MTLPSYRILMVCTGNICRSPLMERLFTACLELGLSPEDAARFEVRSAGTWGMVGSEMSPEAAETLIALGGDPDGFEARAVAPEMLDADLILVATREHRRQVVTEMPTAATRTLTAREFARLLEPVTDEQIDAADPVERMRQIVVAALANRGRGPLPDPGEDDIADPYGRDHAAYQRAADQIDVALAVPLRLLFA